MNELTESSRIVLFLSGRKKDYQELTLQEMRKMSDEELERTHNVIQWMFPTDIRSEYNPVAPVLTPKDIEIIQNSIRCQAEMKLNFERMFRFYEANDNWITYKNHNFKRITRILRSVWLFGKFHEYCSLQRALDDIFKNNRYIIGEETFCYWKNANVDKFMKREDIMSRKEDEHEHIMTIDDYI